MEAEAGLVEPYIGPWYIEQPMIRSLDDPLHKILSRAFYLQINLWCTSDKPPPDLSPPWTIPLPDGLSQDLDPMYRIGPEGSVQICLRTDRITLELTESYHLMPPVDWADTTWNRLTIARFLEVLWSRYTLIWAWIKKMLEDEQMCDLSTFAPVWNWTVGMRKTPTKSARRELRLAWDVMSAVARQPQILYGIRGPRAEATVDWSDVGSGVSVPQPAGEGHPIDPPSPERNAPSDTVEAGRQTPAATDETFVQTSPEATKQEGWVSPTE